MELRRKELPRAAMTASWSSPNTDSRCGSATGELPEDTEAAVGEVADAAVGEAAAGEAAAGMQGLKGQMPVLATWAPDLAMSVVLMAGWAAAECDCATTDKASRSDCGPCKHLTQTSEGFPAGRSLQKAHAVMELASLSVMPRDWRESRSRAAALACLH